VFSRPSILHHRKLLWPLAILLTGGTLVASQAPDSAASGQQRAAGSCSLNVPAKIVINEPSVKPPMTLGADCTAAGVIEAKWEARDAMGKVMNKAFFHFGTANKWHLYDGSTLGKWTWHPTGAEGTGDVTLAKTSNTPPASSGDGAMQATVAIPQNTPTTDVRAGSRAGWKVVAQTQPCVLPLLAYGMRYDPASNVYTGDGQIQYAGGRGSFQQLQRGSTTWTSISGATLPSSGQLQINIAWPKVTTHYRFVLYDAATVWGSTGNLLTYDPSVGC
jgi:hypothetical protein